MRQLSLFGNAPTKKQIKNTMSVVINNIAIKLKNNIVIWIDNQGEWVMPFENEIEAKNAFWYWCKTAKNGGELV